MPDEFAVNKLAAILTNFAAEHGTPNRVSPGEISAVMGPLAPAGARLVIGQIFRRQRVELNARLAASGLRVATYQPDEEGRMYALLEAV